MTSGNLDNLVRAKQLKTEPPDQQEFEGLLGSAQRRPKPPLAGEGERLDAGSCPA